MADKFTPCAWCDAPSHIKQGRILLCAKHYRIANMRSGARRNGKFVPDRQAIEALIPTPFVCQCCARAMTWLREQGASVQATLQHDRDGGLRIICLGCNTRHAVHPGDGFYEVPPGQKRCPDCETIKSVEAFAIDRSRPIGRRAYCRPCAARRYASWSHRHAA